MEIKQQVILFYPNSGRRNIKGRSRGFFSRSAMFAGISLFGWALSGCQVLEKVPLWDLRHTLDTIETRRFTLDKSTSVFGDLAVLYPKRGDSLPDIARHFELGSDDIAIANPGVDIWLPKPRKPILLPVRFILPDAPRRDIVLNLPSMRLFYFPKTKKAKRQVITFPVGIGRKGWDTPTGRTRITYKVKNPTWYVPASIRKEHAERGDPLPRIVPAGPDNPLGEYAIGLKLKGYLIHGTNKPYGVGMRASHGCIRLYPEHIKYLIDRVSVGGRVNIVNQPYLIGWRDNTLYLEANRPLEEGKKALAQHKRQLISRIKVQARKARIKIDWWKVRRILKKAQGVPVPIVSGSPNLRGLVEGSKIAKRPSRFIGQLKVPRLRKADLALESEGFDNRTYADRLAAVFNHLGPPVLSRVVRSKGNYKVLAGPFETMDDAIKASNRIAREFGVHTRVRQPKRR